MKDFNIEYSIQWKNTFEVIKQLESFLGLARILDSQESVLCNLQS